MTGPEHYREAEKRLEASDWQRQEYGDNDQMLGAFHEAAMAGVHATLALAAATALGGASESRLPTPDWQAWYNAAATPQDVTR